MGVSSPLLLIARSAMALPTHPPCHCCSHEQELLSLLRRKRTPHGRELRILVIGDSQERHLVLDACKAIGGRYHMLDMNGLPRLSDCPGCPHVCEHSNVRTLQFMTYGVKPNASHAVTAQHINPGETTELPERLGRYLPNLTEVALRGAPTHVLAHSGLWDLLSLCSTRHAAFQTIIKGGEYSQWLSERLWTPLRLLYPHANLMWRTVPPVARRAVHTGYIMKGCMRPPFDAGDIALVSRVGEMAAAAASAVVLPLAKLVDAMIAECGEGVFNRTVGGVGGWHLAPVASVRWWTLAMRWALLETL